MSAGSPAAAEDADALLLSELKAGRREAFDALYRRYSRPVYDYCARIVGDREEAEDLTHDVFVKAMRRLPNDAGATPLRPWLYRVATNTCVDALRRRRVRHTGSPAVDRVATPVDEYRRSEDAALIERTLAGLSLRYRTVLVLRDLRGLEPQEIAEVLDVPRATADVVVHRARAAFRRDYAALAGDDRPAAACLSLAPLALPAALRTPPWWPASGASGPASIDPQIAAAGPAGSGLLAKPGASLGVKVAAAVAAAVATAVLAGGVVLVGGLTEGEDGVPRPSRPASATVATGDARDLPKTSHEARAAPVPEPDAHRPAHDTAHETMEMADHTADAHLDDAMHERDTRSTGGTTRDAKSVSDDVTLASVHTSSTHEERSQPADTERR